MAHYSIKKLINLFGMEIARGALVQAEKAGNIPHPSRQQRGSIKARMWQTSDLPMIGERYGFLSQLGRPTAVAVFSTKGGVLKTTLAFNMARLAALHNIKTCVVGLDIQADITRALGFYPDVDEESDLSSALDTFQTTSSLVDLFQGDASLEEIVITSEELPTLSLIPESSGFAALDIGLMSKARREYWLKDHVIAPLKKKFDLIIMDCSPSWSQITSNALVACDVLVSPLETKINHFRNYPDFDKFLADFEKIMELKYTKIAVPTRFNNTRKLCVEIRNWYLSNIKGCTSGAIREAVAGEEAMSLCQSLLEYSPTSLAGVEMRDLMKEIWSRFPSEQSKGVYQRQEKAQPRGRKRKSLEIEANRGHYA